MRTIIYVDGFNFYYGCLKGTPYKWLDLDALFRRLLSDKNQITKIKYFTATVSGSASNRQKAYINALEYAIPHLEIYYGHFLINIKEMSLADNSRKKVRVRCPDEKGSDVNLATQALNDAWLDEYDCAVIVSNDSDMVSAMQLVRKHHPKKKLGLMQPCSNNRKPSKELKRFAHFHKNIEINDLANSQLPNTVIDKNNGNKQISKPPSW